jgi:hypothetical protein
VWAYHCDTEYSKESILGEGFVAFSLSCDDSTGIESPVAEIIALSKIEQIDMVVFEVSYEDGQRTETYFKTNISNDFLNISTAKGSSLLNSDEYFANIDLSENSLRAYKLNTTAVDSIIIYPFEQLEVRGYDIYNCVLYCKNESAKKLFQSLKDKGYTITNYSYSAYTVDSNSKIVLIPATMFIVAVLFFTLSNSKKIVLMKMDGYSCFDIVGQEIAANFMFDSILVLTLSILTIVAVKLIVGYPLLRYLKETSNIFLLAFYTIVLSIIIRLFITAITNKHAHVKGAVPQKALYSVITVVKALALIGLLITCISTVILDLIPAINSYKSSIMFADKIKNRVSFSQYGNYEQTLLDDQNVNLLPFYKEVCETRDALYVDASDYSAISGEQAWKLGKEDKPRLDVNENYINISKICDLNGNKITSDALDPLAFNVLVPDQISDQDKTVIEIYRKSFKFDKANILIYDSTNYEMYSFITNGVDSDLGMIATPPRVFVYNYHLFELIPDETSQILYGKLFVKTSTDNPEAELRPVIKKYNLENTIDRVSSVDKKIQEYLKDTRDYLVSCIASVLLLAAVIIGISVFSADTYCRNNAMKISMELIEGKTIAACVNKHLILQVIAYIFILGVTLAYSIVNHTNLIITCLMVLVVVFIDYLITYARCLKQSYKNLCGIIKGEK